MDFQGELAEAGLHMPIIFITGHGDVPMSIKATTSGAVEFLTQPFRDQDLLDAISPGFAARPRNASAAERTFRLASTMLLADSTRTEGNGSSRSGMLNKQITSHLGTSDVKVKIQRHLVPKMQPGSLA